MGTGINRLYFGSHPFSMEVSRPWVPVQPALPSAYAMVYLHGLHLCILNLHGVGPGSSVAVRYICFACKLAFVLSIQHILSVLV